MNKNSLRNSPTPAAPAASAAGVSSGISMLASSSTSCPSSVVAGVCSRRSKRLRSSACWRWRKLYSSSVIAGGLMMMTPLSPSITIRSSLRIRWLAPRAPTMAGMPMLRATMAVWLVVPPTSVIKPLNTLWRKCSMSDGDKSCATSTRASSGSSAGASGAAFAAGVCAMGSGKGLPCSRLMMRSMTCSKSALRSRR